MATNNNFTVIGFVAVDANVVKNNNGSAFARFPLAIRTTKKDKDGNEKKISALQNIEVGTKADSPKLDLLKKASELRRKRRKGTLYTRLEGYRHREGREERRYTGGLAKPPFQNRYNF